MEQIEYTRTVVPSSMRSPYWKYFGFPSDNANNILTRQKIVCTICNTAITYNKNTSNLRTHLMSKHFDIFQEIIMTLGGTKDQIGDKEINEITTENCYMLETNHTIPNKRLCREPQEDTGDILEWGANPVSENFIIIPDSNSNLAERETDPINKFSSDLLIENCKYLNADDNLNGSDVVKIVELGVENQNKNSGSNLNVGTTFALEANSEVENKKITDSMETMLADMVQTDLITLDALTKQGFCQYNQHLTGIRIDEGIIERITEVIEKRFIKTQQIINAHVADLSHMQPFSLSIETYVNNDRDRVMNIYFNYLNVNGTKMDSILYRSCSISHTSPNISNLLSDINLKNCSGVVVPYLEKVHASVFEFAKTHEIPVMECLETMLTNCLNKICESCEILVDFERIFHSEMKVISTKQKTPKFGCCWSKLQVLENILKSFNQPELEQWQELLNCINYLKPLKMALNIVAKEKLPSCSLIRPTIIKLYEEHFAQAEYHKSEKILIIKRILQKDLYEKVIMQNFLKEATYFDPRFHRNYAYPETVFALKEIKSNIVKRFKSILNLSDINRYEENLTKETFTDLLTTSEQCNSLKTFFQRGSYLSNFEIIHDEVKTDLDSELELYHMNECLDFDQSPVLWWQQVTSCYKQLPKIAEFYLTVPCFYMPRLYHLNLEQRRFILERRKNLNQLCQTESRLWYLFYNNWINTSV